MHRHAASTLTISVGASASRSVIAARGTKLFNETNPSGCSHDIALILLDKPVAGASVVKVRLAAVPMGEPAVAVGYGEDGKGALTNGRKQRTALKVDAVGPRSFTYSPAKRAPITFDVPVGEIVTGESTCFGDSGGPLFDGEGRVIGVTSRGVDGACLDRPSIYSDVASHVALLSNALKEAGFPLGEGDFDAGTAGGSPSGTSGPSGMAGNGSVPAPDVTPDASGASADVPAPSEGTGPKRTTAQSQGGAGGQGGCSASPSTSAPYSWMVGLVAFAVVRRRRSTRGGVSPVRGGPMTRGLAW